MNKVVLNQTFTDMDGNVVGKELTAFILKSDEKTFITLEDGSRAMTSYIDDNKELTLKRVICRSLLANKKDMDQTEKSKRFSLWRKVDASETDVELSLKERTRIVKAVWQVEGVIIAGQAEEYMEDNQEESQDVNE